MKYLYSFFEPVDEYGNIVSRTKDEYPYSYDGFVTHRGGTNEEIAGTVYSDRLYQWDYQKYNKLSTKYFGNEGQIFYDRTPKKIEKFLQEYLEKPKLKLILIMEYCNVSNGYPLWRFDYSY